MQHSEALPHSDWPAQLVVFPSLGIRPMTKSETMCDQDLWRIGRECIKRRDEASLLVQTEQAATNSRVSTAMLGHQNCC